MATSTSPQAGISLAIFISHSSRRTLNLWLMVIFSLFELQNCWRIWQMNIA